MQLGDIVAVVDPASPRRGTWGLFSHTTRAGQVVITFIDGSVESMNPFQVDDIAGLVGTAVLIREAVPARSRPPAPRAAPTRSSHTTGCRCGHPQHKHRQYRGYVACTCLDAPRRQCRCRCFSPPPSALESALGELFERAAQCERDWDRDEARTPVQDPESARRGDAGWTWEWR